MGQYFRGQVPALPVQRYIIILFMTLRNMHFDMMLLEVMLHRLEALARCIITLQIILLV